MALSTTSPELTSAQQIEYRLLHLLDQLDLAPEALHHLPELSPYLILDGHRTGIDGEEKSPAQGYIEGAMFSLRFVRILQEMGGRQASFLIHTLRNYSTMGRMQAIFDGVDEIAHQFIKKAHEADIRLKYYGHDVRGGYALAKAINAAEQITGQNKSFRLNFMTNYSQSWGYDNPEEMADLPEITVVGRFTKGHYSGAGLPTADKANFIYIQQASVSDNWSDEEIMILILTLLKSHLALRGFVGGKTYDAEEKAEIRQCREIDLFEEQFVLAEEPSKRVTSFSPKGPMTIYF